MSQTLRTFIGVSIPCSDPLRDVLTTCREFGRTIRPVAEQNIHVTLRFLGPTPDSQVADIANALQTALQPVAPFSAALNGLGAFPHLRRPSVIWAGFRDPAPWEDLADRIKRPLRDLGVPRDKQRFHPHVTLARVRGRPPAELRTWLESEADTDFGPIDIHSATFFQSDLDSTGPRYTILATAPLLGQQKD